MTETVIEIVGAATAVVAIAGVILNNRRRRCCFLLWIGSNAASAMIHMSTDPIIWTMVARDLLFLALAIDGWRRWGDGR
jgi:nicotinamide riboside transporter PnuC